MLQSTNCIRLGQVLLDENNQIFMLCNNCHMDIKSMAEFRRHLEKCEGLENIFQEKRKFKYNTDKSTQIFGKTAKGLKEYLIYDYTDIDAQLCDSEKSFIDLMNIEEELLDPKWYSQTSPVQNPLDTQKPSKQYDVLMEEVTQFVQFKENLKSNTHISSKNPPRQVAAAKTSTTNITKAKPETKAKPTAKRKLQMNKVQNKYTTPHAPESLIALDVVKATESPQLKDSSQASAAKRCRTNVNGTSKCVSGPQILQTNIFHSTAKQPVPSVSLPAAQPDETLVTPLIKNPPISNISQQSQPAKEKQTAQILSKLQNLGLQIKRTQTFPTPTLNVCKKTDDKTLEILMKLQSKGMKVKVLNKHSSTTAIKRDLITPVGTSVNYCKAVVSLPNLAVKSNINKNLVIRKVN